MKKKFVRFFILAIFIAGISYHVYTVIDLKNEIKALKDQQSITQNVQSGTSINDLDYYKKMTSRAISLLTPQQLVELAKTEWDYKLTVNGEEFKGQPLKIEGNNLELVLSEEREPRSILPQDLWMQGQLKDYFYKQIDVESQISPQITNSDEEFSTRVYYNFPKLSHGDTIKITLTKGLSERLGLKDTSYIISIK